MSRFGIILIACGTYLVLCGVNLAINRPRIQTDLTTRTQSALANGHLSYQDLKFIGRDATVTVRGTAASESISKTATQVWGVRVANVVSLPERPPAMRAEIKNSQVSLTGDFPPGATPSKLTAAANALLGASNTHSDFKQSDEFANPTYLARLPATLTLLAAVGEGAVLELRNRQLILTGTVADENVRATIEGTATEMVPAELQFVNQVKVLPRQTAAAVVTATPTPTPEPHTDVIIPKEAIPAPAPMRSKRASLNERHLGFYFDSVKLVADSLPRVPELVEMLKQHPGKKIRIVGYTDSTGTARYNLRLSQRRAKAVLKAFVAKGLSAETFATEGRGATNFIGDNSTAEGQALNRRVELKVIGTLAG